MLKKRLTTGLLKSSLESFGTFNVDIDKYIQNNACQIQYFINMNDIDELNHADDTVKLLTFYLNNYDGQESIYKLSKNFVDNDPKFKNKNKMYGKTIKKINSQKFQTFFLNIPKT